MVCDFRDAALVDDHYHFHDLEREIGIADIGCRIAKYLRFHEAFKTAFVIYDDVTVFIKKAG